MLFIPFVYALHEVEYLDLVCSRSSKKSAEIGNCTYGGKFISFDINFLRPLNDWKVILE